MMDIIRDAASCPPPANGTVVTIGAYDGVHRGHQEVISQVRTLARARGLQTAVVTFDRHPAAVVRPESAPPLLTDLDQKLELLDQTGVDYVYVIHFDEARSKEPAEDFVTEVLLECLDAKVVVVGEDFHFGHQRRGNVALLEAMGAASGFEVVGVGLVGIDGRIAREEGARVSSTAIRAALRQGRIDAANTMLGRPYEVRGVVVDGDKRARDLGFPTANLRVPDDVCLPADGIYAGWYAHPHGQHLPAAISLGRRPTFYEEADRSLLEAHVLDFDGDLYGQVARVLFVARLRDELKFDSVDALVAQMSVDVDRTRELLVELRDTGQ
jgi:riboflavin kinase/FMN adenylyltransferase